MTTAVILAGGMGTRLRSVVPDLPKPMAPVRNRPFLEYQMDYWIEQGVNQFIVSVGYMKEVIMNHFGASYRGTLVTYVIENEPLGTGGGLLLAAQGLREPFLLLNGDTFFKVNLLDLQKFHDSRTSDWTLSLFRTNEVGRYMGVDMKNDGQIISLQSTMGVPSRLANGGVYLIDPSVLEKTKFVPGNKLSLEDELMQACLVNFTKVYGLEFSGSFIDIGIPEDYRRATDILPD